MLLIVKNQLEDSKWMQSNKNELNSNMVYSVLYAFS